LLHHEKSTPKTECFFSSMVARRNRTHSRFANFANHSFDLLLKQVSTLRELGSYLPLEDLKACFQGAERAKYSPKAKFPYTSLLKRSAFFTFPQKCLTQAHNVCYNQKRGLQGGARRSFPSKAQVILHEVFYEKYRA
jgi:hypothetical protein